MEGYRTVLFDLDGTLLDTAPDFHRILNLMLGQHGQAAVELDWLRQYVSLGARAMVSKSFALPAQAAETDQLLDQFLTLYEQQPIVHSQLFEGLDQLLNWLDSQAIPWGVVTNKPSRFSQPILTTLGLRDRCASLICPDQVRHSKPDPESLLLACQELNCLPEDTLYIGDHARDIEAGQRAGMRTIACGYGYIQPEENPAQWNSTYLIEDTQELAGLLKSLYLESRA